eukprot:1892073-Rhodomonas_salina.1
MVVCACRHLGALPSALPLAAGLIHCWQRADCWAPCSVHTAPAVDVMLGSRILDTTIAIKPQVLAVVPRDLAPWLDVMAGYHDLPCLSRQVPLLEPTVVVAAFVVCEPDERAVPSRI